MKKGDVMIGRRMTFVFDASLHHNLGTSFYNGCVVEAYWRSEDGRFKVVVREAPADKAGMGMVGTCFVASAAELIEVVSEHSSAVA